MFVEMMCGGCESSFSLTTETSDNDDSGWFLVYRFANAHTACNYMTSAVSEEVEEPRKKRLIKPRREDDDEES